MINKNIGYSDPSKWALIFSLITVLYISFSLSEWKNDQKIIIHDVLPFYAYLPATFIHNDLSLEFLKEDRTKLGKNFWGKEGPMGKTVITASCGMSMLYSPFFITAHLLTPNTKFENNGYTQPYKLALAMSSIFYLMLGAFFLRKFLIKYFSKLSVAITIVIIIFATNMLWYATVESAMSHVFSFALITIFVYVTDLWFNKNTLWRTILIGLLIGLISLVRPSNLVIVLLLIFWRIGNWNDLKFRFMFFIKRWHLVLLMIAMFFVVWTPQMIYWKYVTGSYLYYSYPDSQGFFFLNPQFFGTMFSWRKGLFIYTPVLIFAVFGIGLLYKKNKELFWPIVIFGLVNWYVISSWWDWWYGGSFGLRPFIDTYSLFAVGLAAFLSWVLKTRWLPKTLILTVFIVITVVSTWHYKRYLKGSIHWVAMTKDAYFNSFWRATPAPNFYEKLRMPDYELARKGIYKYEDETQSDDSEN